MRKLLLTIICLTVIGCGAGNTETESLPDPNYNFTGTWNGNLTGGSTATTFTVTGTQNENDVYGTLSNDAGFTFSVTGTAWENNIILICVDINNENYKLTCTGSVGEILGIWSATGSWSDSVGQEGVWNATKE